MLKLEKINKHSRDKNINFNANLHEYTYKNQKFISVTTLIHNLFEKFDPDKIIDTMMKSPHWQSSIYFNMTRHEIKQKWNEKNLDAIEQGTRLHQNIEYYLNDIEIQDESKEFLYFLNFMKHNSQLEIYRTEWCIYDESFKIGGMIDMVAKDKDGNIILYDWKRTKKIRKFNDHNKICKHPGLEHLHDVNFVHYSLQLSMYKYILEKNYNVSVSNMYLVCLHPDNFNNNYILYKCEDLTEEVEEILKKQI